MITPKVDVPDLPKCECGGEIPAHVTSCVVCAESVGFPNVRYAERAVEVAALDQRFADAKISAGARGSLERLEAFGMAVDKSEAVVSRSLGDLDVMLSGGGKLMQAYHPAVRAGLRVPQNNEHDPMRDVNDARVSPHFYDRLHYAALSLDRRGVPHYGDCAITLREDRTAKRTTVFEENPVVFNGKHPLGKGRPLPYGYRAIWKSRSRLAVAKLHAKIEATTQDGEFAGILMQKAPVPEELAEPVDAAEGAAVEADLTDFIEVHVYGDLHPGAFAHVSAEILDDPIEQLLWDRAQQRLGDFGITFEEVSA